MALFLRVLQVAFGLVLVLEKCVVASRQYTARPFKAGPALPPTCCLAPGKFSAPSQPVAENLLSCACTGRVAQTEAGWPPLR